MHLGKYHSNGTDVHYYHTWVSFSLYLIASQVLAMSFMVSLMLQVGKLSTGNSLDMSPQDEASIIANDATIKDMEVTLAFFLALIRVSLVFPAKSIEPILDLILDSCKFGPLYTLPNSHFYFYPIVNFTFYFY